MQTGFEVLDEEDVVEFSRDFVESLSRIFFDNNQNLFHKLESYDEGGNIGKIKDMLSTNVRAEKTEINAFDEKLRMVKKVLNKI